MSELVLPGFKAPSLLLRGARPNGLGMGFLFSMVFLFRINEGSSVLVVSSWLQKFLVSCRIAICLLSIVRTTECLIVFMKL